MKLKNRILNILRKKKNEKSNFDVQSFLKTKEGELVRNAVVEEFMDSEDFANELNAAVNEVTENYYQDYLKSKEFKQEQQTFYKDNKVIEKEVGKEIQEVVLEQEKELRNKLFS